ncbi:MAG TPA: hypothetical protein VLT86_11270 [Vicinamibacterales bacterium]|nr:hypothetical protein [Vicinamibacterales bacterium]
MSVLAWGACAPHVFVPPSGPGEPFPDAAEAWAEAARACRGASTYAATIRVHGRAGPDRLNATMIGLVTAGDQISLTVPMMFGPPVFILGGTASSATLWLPRDRRVLTARADEIVEAVTGLRLTPRALLAILSGCVGQSRSMSGSLRYGKLGEITADDARVFVERQADRWRITRGLVGGLIVDYQDLQGDWPRVLRVTTEAGRSPAVDLTMSIEQIEVNVTHPARDFVVSAAADAAPMSLEELRAAGPLREKK